ncbi:MAG: PLP-dependent aminotransferase family protein [Deltaproteobacteria bacterium]|jgi:DNA-binding transcriptional MocR family regulator|nr:PLP-dependent aminotransferase family protein [Deltaproteobacteria bacterium]
MAKVQITQVSVPEGWIDFGIGQPQIDILPLDQMAKAAAHRLDLGDHNILQYGMQQGDGNFRITLSQFLSSEYAAPVDPDHLFITAGISQALNQICALHSHPGDAVVVEEPTYFLALRIFTDFKLKIISTPIDENGLIIEALEENLAKYNPAFIYTIPTFHNPAGVTLTADRREKLVSLAEKYNTLVVADEVYQMLAYTSNPPLPMIYYDTSERVLSLGSFSKILAPGLRLGWMQAKPQLLEPFIVCGYLDSGGGLNPFVSSIVNSLIELGLQKDYLNSLRKTYRERMVALSQALRQNIPALQYVDPDGGYFIWSYLPEATDAETLLAEAHQQQVGFQPGIKFSSMGGLRNYLRFCFAYYGHDQLVEGVQRLAAVIK